MYCVWAQRTCSLAGADGTTTPVQVHGKAERVGERRGPADAVKTSSWWSVPGMAWSGWGERHILYDYVSHVEFWVQNQPVKKLSQGTGLARRQFEHRRQIWGVKTDNNFNRWKNWPRAKVEPEDSLCQLSQEASLAGRQIEPRVKIEPVQRLAGEANYYDLI